jgi:phosphatidate cytidylyltransferase
VADGADDVSAAVSGETDARRGRSGRELTLRVGSAVVLIAASLWAAWHGGLPWAIASMLVAAAMAFEWTRMADTTKRYASLAVAVASLCGLGFVLGPELVQVTCVVIFAITLALAAHRGGPVAIMGAGYLALTGYALAAIRVIDPEHGQFLIFALFAIVWSTDTGAYGFGRWIGGPKLLPSVSPNKTWAGFVGGCVAGCAAVGILAAALAKPVAAWMVLGVLTAVVAQGGDLLESMAKRYFGVKDTAGFIPGHGGVLDRLDGHLSSALFLVVLFSLPPVRNLLL